MTKENTRLLSLNGQEFDAKVVYVYDGDTIHVVFRTFNNYYRWNCRIFGVDTPELRTKDEKEKKKGYMVRDKVKENFFEKIVKIKCYDFDKYGRLLIDVYLPKNIPDKKDTTLLSEWLIANGYAYAYGGGTKIKWDL
jgi:endonuclease YncB( thermonuclease family)